MDKKTVHSFKYHLLCSAE